MGVTFYDFLKNIFRFVKIATIFNSLPVRQSLDCVGISLNHSDQNIITLRLSRAAHQRSWRPRMFDGGADESRERELYHGRN
jgi:hypothetical protein